MMIGLISCGYEYFFEMYLRLDNKIFLFYNEIEIQNQIDIFYCAYVLVFTFLLKNDS